MNTICKKFLPLLVSLLSMAALTSCKSDDIPESFTIDCDLSWNGPELPDGGMLLIDGLDIGTLTITYEDGLVTTVPSPVVDRVEYFIGNRLIGTSQTPPYGLEHSLDGLPVGTHQFRVDIVMKEVPQVDDFRVWFTRSLFISDNTEASDNPDNH